MNCNEAYGEGEIIPCSLYKVQRQGNPVTTVIGRPLALRG